MMASRQGPQFAYAGMLVTIKYYTEPPSTLVRKWDIFIAGLPVDRANPQISGLTLGDVALIDQRVSNILRISEGWTESDIIQL